MRNLGKCAAAMWAQEAMEGTGYLYAAKAPNSSIIKIGKTRNDPGTYIARRYAYYLELTNVMRVHNVDMAEKIVLHRLKDLRSDRSGGNEVFQDMDWRLIQEEFEFAARMCGDEEAVEAYWQANAVPRRPARSVSRYDRVDD